MSSPPESARVVVVGAGIAGAGVAHHLAERGWEDIVVVDQGPLFETGGSTSHAPGLVFQHNASRTMTRLAQWTVEKLTALGAFHPVGSIEVATTDERWAELDRRWARARGFGLDARLLDPAQVAELLALLDPETIIGGLHVADDGIAKGVRAAQELCRHEAIAAFGECEVTGLLIEGGRAVGVETVRGTIRAEHVVIAAGIWGRELARLAPGLNVPLVPVEHQLAYTAPLPELAGETREIVHPILRHQDHSMYFRQHADAYGIGNYRHAPRLVEPEAIRPPGSGEQPSIMPFTDGDFATAVDETARLLPPLAGVPLTRTLNGLMSFTPDGAPLLGESLDVRGLWLAEAIWVTHSGGAARALAELMTMGDVQLDLHDCDPRRFDAHGLSRTYARARGAQQYREVYDAIHARQQSEQVRGLRRTPFHARQAELGAVFYESAGWERPQWYEANADLPVNEMPERSAWSPRYWSPIVAAEHLACRERVGLFDASPFTKVEVSGPGALAYLQRLAANQVDVAVGRIVYTAMLAPRGGIMCDLTITRLGEQEFLVVTGGAVGKHDLAWMRMNLPPEGVSLHDRTSGLCCIGVWGPRARDLVASISEDDLSNDAFPYMRARDIHIGAVAVRALRISYVGELGWEIYAPTEFGAALWDLIWQAGEPHGAVACGGGCYDSLRLEKGYRLWGQDIDEEHDPYEAGLGWAVKLDKGPFIGSEAAAAIRERGVTRRLSAMVTDDPSLVLLGKEPILLEDGSAVVGWVTSAGWGATIGESILYGYVPVDVAEPGTKLSVYAEGGRHGVTVAAEPLFDPGMERLRDKAPAATPA